MDEEKTVRLRGKGGEAVEVPEKAIAAASSTIKGAIDDGGCAAATGVVDLPTLTAATLSRVVEYVKKHFGSATTPSPDYVYEALARFDGEFVSVDNDTLIDLIEAATLLNMDGLLDLACKAVAEQMRGRTPDEIRKKFNIVNDYTEEEEEEVRRENSWAFESA